MISEIVTKVRLDNGELQADVQDAKKIVDTGISEIEKNSIDLKVDAKSTESLRSQMRKAQQEVAELSLRFGATSKATIEAAKRAAELRDRIEDANDAVLAFKGEGAFLALSKSVGAVANGFTAVQGAIGIFGVKSEEVEEALLKVNSAMALSQGLAGLEDAGRSFKLLGGVIKSTTAFQFLYNAATSTATAVQTAFGVATNVTTTGFKLLRGAIISTGIGALVVGLGMVIANFDSISAWIKNSPLGAFANQIGSIVEKFTDFIGVTSEAERASDRLAKANGSANKAIENRIKLLKAQGGSEKEIATLQKQAIQNDINVLNSKKKLSDEEKQTREDLKNDLLVIDAEYNKKVQDENKKASEKAAEEAKKRNEEAKKRNEEAIKQQRELEKRKNEIAFNAAQDRQKVLDEIENANYKNEFERERQQIRDEFFLKIETNKELEDELIKIREARIAEVNKKEQEANKKTAEDQKKNIASVNIALGDAAQRGFETREEYEQRLFEQQKKQFNEIFEFANNGILLQIGLNPQDVNRVKGSIENLQNTLNNKGATPQEKAAAYAEAAGAVAGTVSNALFAADTQRRQEELAALQAQQEEELRLAGDNEQKKDLIRQKYAFKEKEIKRKQAEADKKKAMLDIVINTAVAVVKAFATTGPIAGPVFAAIVGALGLAQLALVAAQPIPKFEKGGAIPSSDIQGMISGKPHAAGGVLIEAEGNEFITRRSQAMKGDNLGLLEAINMSDSERDAYINRHYVMPALQAKESEAAKSYRSSIIEAENNLIARVSSSTLKSIDRRLVETNQSIKGLGKKDYTW
jgi:hypothetical protein